MRSLPFDLRDAVKSLRRDASYASTVILTLALERTPPLMVYVPYWWRSRAATSLLVRTRGDPAVAVPAIRGAVLAIDPEIAIGEARPLERIVEGSIAARRYQMTLFVA